MSKYHYIVGIALKGIATYDTPPEFYMKYFYSITKEEWNKYVLANKLMKNKLWKTSSEESLKATGAEGTGSSLYSMNIAAKVNDATLHHFMSDNEISEEWFDSLPKSKYGRELLDKAKI